MTADPVTVRRGASPRPCRLPRSSRTAKRGHPPAFAIFIERAGNWCPMLTRSVDLIVEGTTLMPRRRNENMLVALVVLFGTRRTSPYPSGRDGIKPTQTAKPRKITVRGAKGKPVLHSQRSQMSVRDEIAMHARQREKFAEHIGVPFRWLRY